MRRREFIAGLGGAAAWPVLARAQRPMPVIGLLNASTPTGYASRMSAFHQGLGETAEGRNVTIEYRWAENQLDRLPAMAADLVRRQVTVIFAAGIPAVRAAKAATATMPIVFQGGFDPVEVGIVSSLNRPGGNLTGVSSLSIEMAPKRLELLHETVPKAAAIALLVNPTNPTSADYQTKSVQAAASSLGRELHILHARAAHDLEMVFASLAQRRIGGLVISNEGLFNSQSEQLAALSVRNAVPAIFQDRDFTTAGGLMSYGTSSEDAYRLAGVYVGRILKGEQPADLPVQQSTKVELFINLKAAKALGLIVPLPLLARADEVVE
jgi:putative ABC transport system substrate-binding protein